MALFVQQTGIIAAGQSLSAAVAIGESQLHGILFPASWTTAALTLQTSLDGTNFFELYDDSGNEITIAAAASRYCALDPTRYRSLNLLILRSGTVGVPVSQVSQATIILQTRPIF